MDEVSLGFVQFGETPCLFAVMLHDHDRQIFKLCQNGFARWSMAWAILRIDSEHRLALEIFPDIAFHECHCHQGPQQNVHHARNSQRLFQKHGRDRQWTFHVTNATFHMNLFFVFLQHGSG